MIKPPAPPFLGVLVLDIPPAISTCANTSNPRVLLHCENRAGGSETNHWVTLSVPLTDLAYSMQQGVAVMKQCWQVRA